jgi:hypothetical protein
MRRWANTILIGTAVLSSGCAGPITQTGAVSSTDVRTEQLQQLRLAAELALANQQRVDRLAAPLLDAAGPLCGSRKQAKPPKAGRGGTRRGERPPAGWKVWGLAGRRP